LARRAVASQLTYITGKGGSPPNGIVDVEDLLFVLANFGRKCSALFFVWPINFEHVKSGALQSSAQRAGWGLGRAIDR
jgi:hypothetical protein